MVKYRPHRGTLEEAMKGYREFNTVEELIQYVADSWDGFIDTDDIVIGDVLGSDDRIGWKAYRYVLTKRCGDEIYDTPQCIGMCDLGDLV